MEDWNGQRVHGYELVSQWMQAGILSTADLVTHRFPFHEYKQAVATATDKRTGVIKVVLQMGRDTDA
jgi:threonine dehydrogenase-like Zn-dependent dehydrogenase